MNHADTAQQMLEMATRDADPVAALAGVAYAVLAVAEAAGAPREAAADAELGPEER